LKNIEKEEKLIFEKSEGKKISKNKIVKVIKTNHIVEIISVQKDNSGIIAPLKKISKTEYMNINTGEIKEYNLSENRGENPGGVKKSFRFLRPLVNNNFDGSPGEKHIILTYAENMTDLKRLHKDYKKFWEKFKYRYPEAEYIAVAEPQGRGAWHLHVLMKTNQKYIKNKDIEEMWGQGFTKTKPLEQVDNIGAYLTAYFTDLEIEQHEIPNGTEKVKEVEGKKYIKGARLKLYPAGMKIYRTSKGIIKPIEEKIKYSEIKKIVGTATPNYSQTTSIKKGETILNQVTYEQYNLKRKKIQE
jgi:hypothetical protein